ncbi:MAG: ATP synthase delta/epsilon chain alpha-helix domain-containing protein, partial [Ruminococcus sp.]|nr:ATP synthase delta/epsilon chain alpha-helix domain-containing protein [Ruminococcus sp.]
RAAEAATRAKERLRQRQSIMQYYQSQAALNRAMNRLKISRRHNHEI